MAHAHGGRLGRECQYGEAVATQARLPLVVTTANVSTWPCVPAGSSSVRPETYQKVVSP